MTIQLDRGALQAYRARRWDLVEESKLAHWAEQAGASEPGAGLEIGAALWAHARSIDPAWPTDRERSEDYEHHVALAATLRRVAHVFACR